MFVPNSNPNIYTYQTSVQATCGTLSTCGTAETMGPAPKVVPVVAFLGLAVFTLADFRNENWKLKGIHEYANDTDIQIHQIYATIV